MILTPKNPTDPCGQPAKTKPGFTAVYDPCQKGSEASLPRNLGTTTSRQDLLYVDDSNLHNRLLRDNA